LGKFLNLMPGELEPGDDLGERGIFLRLEPLGEVMVTGRYDCILVYQDDTKEYWHTEAPLRIYREYWHTEAPLRIYRSNE